MSEFIKGDFDIAVIGMACRFPLADDIIQFRDNVFSGRDCITRKAGRSDKNYVSAYGKIEDIYRFDNTFFGIKKEEASLSDPQQRIFLETVIKVQGRFGKKQYRSYEYGFRYSIAHKDDIHGKRGRFCSDSVLR